MHTLRIDMPAQGLGSRLFGLREVGVLLVTLGVLHLAAQFNFLLFHTLVEVLRIVVLGGIFVLVWHTRHWATNSFLKVFGVGALFVAGLEMLHTLSYKGMGIFPGHDANLPTQLWIAFRYLEAGSMLFAGVWLGRPLRMGTLLGAYAGLVSVLLVAIFAGYFPDCFIEGSGLTPFKIYSEYVIAGLFVLSALVLLWRSAHFEADVLWLLVVSLLVGALAEMAFTRYADVFGMANEFGHYLLFVSTYLIYRAVLVTGLIAPFDLMFREVRVRERDLETLVAERTEHLRESQALTTAFVENSPAVIFLTDEAQRFTLANPAFETLMERSRDQIIGHTVFDLMPGDVAQELSGNIRRTLESGTPQVFSERVRTGAKERLFETVHFPFFDEDGRIVGSGGIAADVTDLRSVELRYGTMISTSMDAVLVVDRQGRLIEVNEATCELTGYAREQLLGLRLEELEVGMDREAIRRTMAQIVREGSARFDSRWRRADGVVRDVEISVNYLTQAPTPCFFSFVRDITERKAASARIEHLAHYDQMTNLPNRLLFETCAARRLAAAAGRGAGCALVYLDLDNFKVINDTLGHVTGDDLLRHLGQRLRTLSGEDGLISRFGGDEFLILLEDVADEQAVRGYVDRLLAECAQPLVLDGHELVNTISIGVALFPRDGADFDTLFRNADTAMFVAKAAGRNTYRFFGPEMQADALERLQLLSRLRGALERMELQVYYQPQFDLTSGELVGAEALIRWHHPELGMVPPNRFIPLAEDSGLIVPIGAWVLQQACQQAAGWQRVGGTPVVVAVNLSAVQFRQPQLRQTVVDALVASGLPPECLELELTESLLIGDVEDILQTISDLKALGLKLSIDDFGTGYSSLSYLKRFAVDKLKIDQSFVRDMMKDDDSAALVTTIAQLARNLGLRTIAEGVESVDMLAPLRQLGCDEAQGYHFGRPMPEDEFAAFLARTRMVPPGSEA